MAITLTPFKQIVIKSALSVKEISSRLSNSRLHPQEETEDDLHYGIRRRPGKPSVGEKAGGGFLIIQTSEKHVSPSVFSVVTGQIMDQNSGRREVKLMMRPHLIWLFPMIALPISLLMPALNLIRILIHWGWVHPHMNDLLSSLAQYTGVAIVFYLLPLVLFNLQARRAERSLRELLGGKEG